MRLRIWIEGVSEQVRFRLPRGASKHRFVHFLDPVRQAGLLMQF